MPASRQPEPSWLRSLLGAVKLTAARLRLVMLVGAVVALVFAWPTLRNYFDRLTQPPVANSAISPETEYWCPMCPGVVSDWPSKCPVCHMTLIRRLKGEMAPLPDGVVARLQFSPYRIQLAGIATTRVEYLPLAGEIVIAGLIQPSARDRFDSVRWILTTETCDRDAGWLRVGQTVELRCDATIGQTFAARIVEVVPETKSKSPCFYLRLEVDDPRSELRAGLYAAGVVRPPLATQPQQQQLMAEHGSRRAAVSLSRDSVAALVNSAITYAAASQNSVLAIPESAVVDTGRRQVVYVDRGHGMFDAVEVRLGRRCGTHYPVLAGLEPGEHVVSSGTFLLDAETRLNPAAAAAYFGSGGKAAGTPAAPASLTAEEQRIVERQRICPITEEPLGSMGPPVRVVVEGRIVFVCCEGCTATLRKDPAKYLRKLPKP